MASLLPTRLALLPVALAIVVNLKPGDDVQDAVDANPNGTTFMLAAGEYRLQSVVAKSGNSFIGASSRQTVFAGELQNRAQQIASTFVLDESSSPSHARELSEAYATILNGALLLTNASFDEPSSLWVVRDLQHVDTSQHGSCWPSSPACGYRQELFVNNTRLARQPNRTSVTPGCWCWFMNYADPSAPSSSADVWLSASSTLLINSTILEMSWLATAFTGPTADDVTVSNLVVEKYAPHAQTAAIQPGAADGMAGGWLVSGVEARLNHGVGIETALFSTTQGCYLHDNGQLGGNGRNATFIENEVSGNNAAGFDDGWEAGGAKFAFECSFLNASYNYCHDNDGDGLWTDISSINVFYVGNHLMNNSGGGISHEIGYFAVMEGNVAANNGWGLDVWEWSTQLRIQNSRDVIMRNNTVFVNSSGHASTGLGIISQNRYPWGCAVNNTITNNTIIFTSCNGQNGIVADHNATVVADGGNVMDWNTYVLYGASPNGPGSPSWNWVVINASTGEGASFSGNWSRFREVTGQEQHGSIIATANSTSC